MNDFKKLLAQFGQNAQPEVQVPFTDAPDLPENYNEMASEESYVPASASVVPERTPASTSTETVNKLSTSISGKIPSRSELSGDKTPESPEGRLERLMKELKAQRDTAAQDAASREFKAGLVKTLTDNVGNMVGGATAMNTGASVNPIKTQGYDVGDLVGKVDKRYAGDSAALMEQYKQLLKSKDQAAEERYRQDSLQVQREGNRLRNEAAMAKIDAKSGGLELTPGEEVVDKKFGDDYNKLTSKGFNNAEVAIGKIEAVAAELEKAGDGLLAPGAGRSSILPDSLRSRDSIRWRDAAQNEANATLKELFPGSLSDDERRAAAKEFYNDQLSNAENAKILRAKAAQLKQNVVDQRQKSEYFAKNGTLKGNGPGNRKPADNTISKVEAPKGMITVSDGKSTMHIDPSDEAEAAKDGFKRIK